jgi:hypothetical protein
MKVLKLYETYHKREETFVATELSVQGTHSFLSPSMIFLLQALFHISLNSFIQGFYTLFPIAFRSVSIFLSNSIFIQILKYFCIIIKPYFLFALNFFFCFSDRPPLWSSGQSS